MGDRPCTYIYAPYLGIVLGAGETMLVQFVYLDLVNVLSRDHS